MKIIAAGMNYIEHNKELEGAFKIKDPVLFLKPDTALLKDGKPFFIPNWMGRVDYEAEIAVRICRLGKSIPVKFAHRYYDSMTLAIDFTARDMQRSLREKGLSWELCKAFDNSAAIGRWVKLEEKDTINKINFRLEINKKTVQQGNTSNMIYSVNELIAFASKFFTLRMGDILLTGTPSGIGPVSVNDHLEGYIEEEKVLEFNCK